MKSIKFVAFGFIDGEEYVFGTVEESTPDNALSYAIEVFGSKVNRVLAFNSCSKDVRNKCKSKTPQLVN